VPLSMCEMAVICISEFLKIRIFGLAKWLTGCQGR